MDSPNRTENRNSGTHASMVGAWWKPSRPPMPCWKTSTSSPKAAPTESRLSTTAVVAMTRERNTTVRITKAE
jgi:hypothetical protein